MKSLQKASRLKASIQVFHKTIVFCEYCGSLVRFVQDTPVKKIL